MTLKVSTRIVRVINWRINYWQISATADSEMVPISHRKSWWYCSKWLIIIIKLILYFEFHFIFIFWTTHTIGLSGSRMVHVTRAPETSPSFRGIFCTLYCIISSLRGRQDYTNHNTLVLDSLSWCFDQSCGRHSLSYSRACGKRFEASDHTTKHHSLVLGIRTLLPVAFWLS
jgi:hypothetical protein